MLTLSGFPSICRCCISSSRTAGSCSKRYARSLSSPFVDAVIEKISHRWSLAKLTWRRSDQSGIEGRHGKYQREDRRHSSVPRIHTGRREHPAVLRCTPLSSVTFHIVHGQLSVDFSQDLARGRPLTNTKKQNIALISSLG